MRFGAHRVIEHAGRLRVEEFGVLGIDDEPAELRWKRLDQCNVPDEPVEELASGDAVVAGLGGIRDEVSALQAFLHR